MHRLYLCKGVIFNMCAIAGILDFAESGRYQTGAAYEQMLDTMERRGPDQSGSVVDGPASLLHTRLCVIDIENGRQPMCNLEWRRIFAGL